MPATLRHFAINADDVPRARRFYESVFGWSFRPWGPPDYYQITNAGTGILGALQERRELKSGVRTSAYEATMGVDDLHTTLALVEEEGGRVLMQPYRIEGVGELAYVEDPEGNLVGIMQYEPGAIPA
ncbi:VOC family protein [Sphingomonas bacterium]|uniref:VOC family protein n=1 Tax=Sphingomonas bacterium TaxID=1895847 RepID=UPI001577600A|nr:VOC family protein [Sphingomonas bacterium]